MRTGILTTAVICLAAVAAGCSDDEGPNQPPTVELTSGPMQGDEVVYRIHLQWLGSDPDGRVEYYRYAVDPPLQFTEMDIAGQGEGTSEQFIPGAGNEPDRTRVFKEVDGEGYSFDWVHTHDTGKDCAFATPDPDSSVVDSVLAPLPRYSGTHAFYVTAVDDAGAVSAPDHVGFTATSITPTTLLKFPLATDNILILGSVLPLEFDGVDPDGPGGPFGPARPVAYLMKLVNLGDLDPPKNLLGAIDPADIVYRLAANLPWEQVDGNRRTLELAQGQYVLAVRAIDETGAVDPFVGYGRPGEAANSIHFQALAKPPTPTVVLSEPGLGSFALRGGQGPTLEAAEGELRFTIAAGAEVDTCEVWSEDTGGWSTVCTEFPCALTPLVPSLGPRVFYVRAHSRFGGEALTTVLLNVVDFPMDRELLLVDDYKDQTYPRDVQHDQFWLDLVADSGRFSEEDQRPEVLMFSSHGPNDVYFLDPQVPRLGMLGRYKMIFYDTHGAGYNAHCGLTGALRSLRQYVGAGGNLWISGQYTAAAMVPNAAGASTIVYPLEIPTDSFAYEVMKILANEVRNDKNGDNKVNGMIGVRPFPGAPADFPAMDVDTDKQSPVLRGSYGIGSCDLIFDPLYEGADPEFRGSIDSLYVFKTIGPTQNPPRSSAYENRLCGIRWHDDAGGKGRTVWFGFPLYYFKNDQAQETFNRVVDWFREEDTP